MFAPDDTIVAIATPPGRGGIGVVRVSGPTAAQVASTILERQEPFRPRHVTLARVLDGSRGETTPIDRVLVTYFPRPGSYTGQDVVEISGHGSPVLLRQIVCAAMRAGARLAEPGEFTLRAFLNGRLDLVQAEAVGDLINAVTPLQARVAFDQLEGTVTAVIAEIDAAVFDLVVGLEASLDFPEEGYHFVEPEAVAAQTEEISDRVGRLLADARRGRLIREGQEVAILGKPNVGKSTIFNHLVGAARAIVTDIAGTTRDLVTEVADIQGIPVTLIDTAGIREAADAVEAEGVARARGALAVADLVLVVLDRSSPLDSEDTALLGESASSQRLVVVNKIDLPASWAVDALPSPAASACIQVSMKTPEGLGELRQAVADALGAGERLRDTAAVTNIRHIELLERVHAGLQRAAHAAAESASEEFVLADLQDARVALEEITGKRTSEDVLRHIFERFCIGK